MKKEIEETISQNLQFGQTTGKIFFAEKNIFVYYKNACYTKVDETDDSYSLNENNRLNLLEYQITIEFN